MMRDVRGGRSVSFTGLGLTWQWIGEVLVERIALISDIHGNLPALEAVLEDIARRGIQRMVCLGDLAGKGPDGDRMVDVCRERCEHVVRGNWDEALAGPHEHPVMQWHQEQLGPERRAWLGNLPFSVDCQVGGTTVRVLHASPQGVYRRVHQNAPEPELHAMFDNTDHTGFDAEPAMVGYGDIHTAYVRTFHQPVSYTHLTLPTICSV